MKKFIKIFFLILIFIFLVIISMYFFKICPPEGPWPKPPWCIIKKENTQFNYKKLNYIPETNLKIDKEKFIFGIGMMDLWGNLCTNPFLCDNPKKDTESSFKRLKEINTKLVMVTDFYQVDRKLNFLNVKIGGARTINNEDMKYLIDTAHKNEMEFMLMTNLYEKNRSREILNFKNPTKKEIDILLKNWKDKILAQSKKGKYDYLVINPRDIAFFFEKEKDNIYVNNKLLEIIPEIKENYSGKICLWGPKNWINNYVNNYDCVIVDEEIKNIFKKTEENLNEITKKWDDYLKNINYNKETFVLILMPSYKGVLKNGWIEPVGEKYDSSFIKDYKTQALVYDGFFKTSIKYPKINGVISYGYWWNDNIYPNTLDIFRNDLSHSIRDKDAESVFYKWSK